MNYVPNNKLPDHTGDGITSRFAETIAVIGTGNGWQFVR